MYRYLSAVILMLLFFVSCSNQRQPMSPEALQTAILTEAMTATSTQQPAVPTVTATRTQQVSTMTATNTQQPAVPTLTATRTLQISTMTATNTQQPAVPTVTATRTQQPATATATATLTLTAMPTSTATATAVETAGWQNNGRLKTNTLDIVMGGVSQVNTFYYAADGRIMRDDFTIAGTGDFNGYFTYTPAGKISSKFSNSGQGIDAYYAYDAQDRLSAYYGVDMSSVTLTALYFSYDADDRINRIDQSNSGSQTSYRLITRDANGYVAREDYYNYLDNPIGYVTYARDDTLKQITLEFYLSGYNAYTLTVNYDSDGFWLGSTCVAHMMPDATYYTQVNVLQAGLFDAGGVHGYYYTDKDLYTLYAFEGSVSDGLYPGP